MAHKKHKAHNNSSLRPVLIQSSIFTLECANNSVYILCSQDASKDLEHFRQGTGAPFCVANTFTGRVVDIALFPVDVSGTAKSLAEAYRSRDVTVCSELEMDEAELGAIAILRRAQVNVGMQTYVLELQPVPGTDFPARYVGKSQDLTKRWANHWQGTAAKWTARHNPVRVLSVDLNRGDNYLQSRSHEDEVTLVLMREAMRKHGPDGWATVRGGKWTQMEMGKPREL